MECIICLEEIEIGPELVISGCCKNTYHNNCIKNWIQNNINNSNSSKCFICNQDDIYINALYNSIKTNLESINIISHDNSNNINTSLNSNNYNNNNIRTNITNENTCEKFICCIFCLFATITIIYFITV